MITIDNLKEYSKKLMFYMNEEEYKTLEEEFKVLLKQVDKIDKIEHIKEFEPISFPFPLEDAYLREDEVESSLDSKEAFSNCKDTQDNQVKLPKVVA